MFRMAFALWSMTWNFHANPTHAMPRQAALYSRHSLLHEAGWGSVVTTLCDWVVKMIPKEVYTLISIPVPLKVYSIHMTISAVSHILWFTLWFALDQNILTTHIIFWLDLWPRPTNVYKQVWQTKYQIIWALIIMSENYPDMSLSQ